MFGLFGKKKSLEEYQKARDWDGLARAYYDLGVSAMDQGSLNMAVLWLHRADTIYSASDGVYEKAAGKKLFHPQIVDDCSERIGKIGRASCRERVLIQV